MAKMNLLLLLDHLEGLADSKFQLAGKVMIDRDELEELLEKIRLALPEEVKEAEWIIREKERYLGQAQEEAERILREAESYIDRLIHENQITVRAEEEARQIIVAAKQTAAHIEGDAMQYADQILRQLEENLDRTLKVVRNGREELAVKTVNNDQ